MSTNDSSPVDNGINRRCRCGVLLANEERGELCVRCMTDEVAALRAELGDTQADLSVEQIRAEKAEAERARIERVIEAMPRSGGTGPRDGEINRADLLAAIRGGDDV